MIRGDVFPNLVFFAVPGSGYQTKPADRFLPARAMPLKGKRQKTENGKFIFLPCHGYTRSMETYTTRLEKSGRILIPAPVRRRLGLSEGSQVVIKVEQSGALQITSRSEALAKARKEIRKYIPASRDLVEELIRDRRSEVEDADPEISRS